MSLVIRAAADGDVNALVALMSSFYAEAKLTLSAAAATRAFSALIATPQLGAVWLAELDAEPVGHIVLAAVFSMEYGGLRGFIDDFYVKPAARGRGIGAALLAAARDGAKARGLRALCVETGLADHPARSLYARAGYVDTEHALLVQPLAAPMHDQSGDSIR